jgi:putative flippase GtrA
MQCSCRRADILGGALLRYICVGGLLFALDYLVTRTLYLQLQQPLEIAQWTGRAVGAAAGYRLHRAITFRLPAGSRGMRWRYWTVAVLLWLISPWVLHAALAVLPASLLAAKILAEAVLVGCAYLVLRRYVYAQPVDP